MFYPPIARVAKISGDVEITYRIDSAGQITDVNSVSDPEILRKAAVDQVKSWRFKSDGGVGQRAVVFHFKLTAPDLEDTSGNSTTHVLTTGGEVEVSSGAGSDVSREGCPLPPQRVPTNGQTPRDFVETGWPLLRVEASGKVWWNPPGEWDAPDWNKATKSEIPSQSARALIERFRTEAFWRLCTSYSRNVTETPTNFLRVSLGGLEKDVNVHGIEGLASFDDLFQAIHEATNSHQWRVGDPKTEQMGDMGADVWLPKPGRTKLMASAHFGKLEDVQTALDSGDSVNSHDESGWTPLMYAVGGYQTAKVVEFLLAKGADVQAAGLHGETVLMFAALRGDADQELIAAGARVNARTSRGATALMLLAQKAETDDLKVLLRAGADARMKDSEGLTAADYLMAASCGRSLVSTDTHPWMTVGYGSCNALNADEVLSTASLLRAEGVVATKHWTVAGDLEATP
ncbi:TonB family protein [Granulicella tundricola MP5ACTX9]|uniref:TonB family protein n=2 Tax=Granulicella TaxID=940557 RepID=E8WWE8_GRATM|nr:TonB family protein [Granulicella tundricola MP5ACTX9]